MTDSTKILSKQDAVKQAAVNKTADLQGGLEARTKAMNYDASALTLPEFTAKYGSDSAGFYAGINLQQAQNMEGDLRFGRNTTLFGDVQTSVGISLGDQVPKLGYGLGALVAPSDTDAYKWFLEGVQEQEAQAAETRRDYSRATQEQMSAQQAAALIRGQEFAERDKPFGRATGIEHAEQFGSAVSEWLVNPRAATMAAGESADAIITMPLGGAVAGGIAKQAVKKKTKDATEEQLNQAAMKAAGKAGLAYTGISEGGHNAIQVLNQVENMSHEQLMENSSEYRELLENPLMTPEQAKSSLAQDIARKTGITSGVLAAVIGKGTGASDAVSQALMDQVGEKGLKAIASRIGTSAAREGGEEILQSGSGQAISNVFAQAADETIDVMEGVTDAAASGLVSGALTGGALSTVTEAVKGTQAASEKVSELKKEKDTGLGKELVAIEKELATVPKTEEGEVDLAQAKAEALAKIEKAKTKRKEAVVIAQEKEAQGEDPSKEERTITQIDSSLGVVAQEGGTKKLNDGDIKNKLKEMGDNVDVDALLSLMEYEDTSDPVSIETLESVAQALPVDSSDRKAVEEIITAKKTSSEVTANVLTDLDAEWRGGGYYMKEIISGIKHDAPKYVDYQLKEITRFNAHMQQKAADFTSALEQAKATGKKVELEDYQSLSDAKGETKSMFVQPNSDSLVQDIQKDAEGLSTLTQQAYRVAKEGNIDFDVDQAVSDVISSRSPEAPKEPVEPVQDEVTTEVPTEPVAEEKVDTPTIEPEVTEQAPVKLTGRKGLSKTLLAKDQAKSDQANKFIGFGKEGSSTAQYQEAWGDKANTGEYAAEDKVFISVSPNLEETSPTIAEVDKAIEAGATIIADDYANRNRKYNRTGEGRLAKYLAQQGYQEVESGSGIWTPATKTEVTYDFSKWNNTKVQKEELLTFLENNLEGLEKQVFQKLRSNLKHWGLRFAPSSKSPHAGIPQKQWENSQAIAMGQTIFINRDNWLGGLDTLYHELDHLVTMEAVKKAHDTYSNAYQNLEEIFDKVFQEKNPPESVKHYLKYLSGELDGTPKFATISDTVEVPLYYMNEFVTIVKTDPAFREWMQTIKYSPSQNLYERLLSLLGSFFSISNKNEINAYEAVVILDEAIKQETDVPNNNESVIGFPVEIINPDLPEAEHTALASDEETILPVRYITDVSKNYSDNIVTAITDEYIEVTRFVDPNQQTLFTPEHLEEQLNSQLVTQEVLDATEGDAAYKAYMVTNELVNEGSIKESSLVGSKASEILSEGISNLIPDFAKDLPKESIEALQVLFSVLDLKTHAEGMNQKFKETMAKARTGKAINLKLSSNWQALFEQSNGELLDVFQAGTPLAIAEMVLTKDFTATKSAMKSLGGIDDKAHIPYQLVNYFNSTGVGIAETEIQRSLGSSLLNISGITFDGTHDNTRNRVRDALGNMVYQYLLDQGILVKQPFSAYQVNLLGGGLSFPVPKGFSIKEGLIYQDGKDKALTLADVQRHKVLRDMTTFHTVKMNWNHPYVKDFPKEHFAGLTGAFSKVLGTDSYKSMPSLKPRKNQDTVRKRTNVLSKTIVEAADKNSKVKHYLSSRMAQVVELLGDDVIKKMLGYKETKGVRLLPAQKALVEAKNRDIEKGITTYHDWVSEMGTQTDDLYNTPMYYNYYGSQYNRLHLDSLSFNPQANKFHRFTSHMEPVEISTQEDNTGFLIGLAQSLDIGVDKLSVDQSLQQLDEVLTDLEMPIDALKNMIQGNQYRQEDIDQLMEFAGSNEKTHTLMGLVEYANFLIAKENGEESFQSHMPLEIDGNNNGPLTALILSARTPEAVDKYLRKAGITDATQEVRPTGEIVGTAEKKSEDREGVYEEAATAINEAVKFAMETGENPQTLLAQLTLKEATGLVSFTDEGDIVVERNEAKKNIIIEIFYGAGAQSITKKDVFGFMDVVYDKLQTIYADKKEGEQLSKEERSDIYETFKLLARASSVDDKQYQQVLNSLVQALNQAKKKNPEYLGLDMEIPLFVQETLQRTLSKGGYSDIKIKAVQDLYSDVFNSFKLLTKTVSAMAPIARQTYEKRYKELLEAQGASVFEDLSSEAKKKMELELLKDMPMLSLAMHDDKDGFTDAIGEYKMEGEKSKDVAKVFRNLHSIGSGMDITKVQMPNAMGSGVPPSSTIPIADASVIVGLMASGVDFLSIFDGLVTNTQNHTKVMNGANKAYLESITQNNLYQQIQDLVGRVYSPEKLQELPYASLKEMYEQLETNYKEKSTTLNMLLNMEEEAGKELLIGLVQDMVSTNQYTLQQYANNSPLQDWFKNHPNVKVDQFGSLTGEVYVSSTETESKEIEGEEVPVKAHYANRNNFALEEALEASETTSITKDEMYKWIALGSTGAISVPPRYSQWLREVLVDQILDPALDKVDIRVVQTTDQLNEILGKKFKTAKGATRTKDGKVEIFLNKETNGVNIETLFHELTHAALDQKIVEQDPVFQEITKVLSQEVVEAWNEKYPHREKLSKAWENNPRELFAWALTNMDVMSTALVQSPSVEFAREDPNLSFFGKVMSWVQSLVKKIIGKRVHEDSVLAYLVESARNMANETKVSKEDQEIISYQEEMESIQKAIPEEVFDTLTTASNNSVGHKRYLNQMFHREVRRLQSSKHTAMSDAALNAMESLSELENQGEDILPHRWEGIFPMSQLETYMFNSYRHIVAAGMELGTLGSQQLHALYAKASKKLKPKDFILDGDTSSEGMKRAQEKYDALFGTAKETVYSVDRNDEYGVSYRRTRNTQLADFISLVRTNEEMRKVISKVSGDISKELEGDTNKLTYAILTAVHKLTDKIAGSYTGANKSKSFKGKVDNISRKLAVSEFRAKSHMEVLAQKALMKGNAIYTAYSTTVDRRLEKIFESTPVKVFGDSFKYAGNLVKQGFQGVNNEEQADRYRQLTHKLNHDTMKWIPELVEEMQNTQEYNKAVRRSFFKKNKAISGARDGAIKAVIKTLKDVLPIQNDKVMSQLTDGILRTDIGSLMKNHTLENVMEYFKDSSVLGSKINQLETELRKSAQGEALINAAHSLGHFQIHHIGTEDHSFPNADAATLNIGRVFNTNLSQYTEVVDQLASLVALQQLPEPTKAGVVRTYQHYPEGVAKTLNLHEVQKQTALTNRYGNNKYNVLKGEVYEVYDPSKDIKVVPTSEVARLKKIGYVVRGNIPRNPNDLNQGEMVVMYSTVNGMAERMQGAFSLARNTKGIQNLDGRTVTDGYDKYDEMQKNSAKIKQRYKRSIRQMNTRKSQRSLKENGTVTTLTDKGTVTGHLYTIPLAKKKALLGSENSLVQTLPHMFGQTVEITNTRPYNDSIVKGLKEAYEYDKQNGDVSNYVEISANAPTRRGKEAWRMMPPEARAKVQEVFGKKMYVRSSLMSQVYGYRKASMANILRDNSASTQWARSLMQNTFGLFFTDQQMIKGIVNGEKALREATMLIKDMIVVRSIGVLVGNLISNTVQLVLANDGMSVSKAVKYTVEGLTLAKKYQENQGKINKLKYELAIEADPRKQKLIENELLVLREEQSRNPASELIDKGALTAIVEDVEEVDNPYAYTAKLGEKFSKFNDRMPESVQWVTGTLLASKQSEWYQTAYQFTQLGDFGSRYAMYKHAKDRQELTPERMDHIMDAFVMYDIPSNKYLEYLGNVGMLWFMKYFMRIQKIIIENTLKNPRKALEVGVASSILPLDTYYDAAFWDKDIVDKMGLIQYAEMGVESLPVMQIYDAL